MLFSVVDQLRPPQQVSATSPDPESADSKPRARTSEERCGIDQFVQPPTCCLRYRHAPAL
jgi:hypothetical protein